MLLSRVAESIYWMSRYLERADNTARLLEVNLQQALDLPHDARAQWEPLVAVTGDLKYFRERYGEPTRENVMRFLTFDRDYPNSIISCLSSARENARSIREALSSELWQEVNRFYLKVNNSYAETDVQHRPYHFFEELRLSGCLCNGMCDFTMSHNDCWHFSQIGRLLERADKTSRILDVKYFVLLPKPEDVGRPLDIVQWSAVLTSASALEMHRRRYGQITPFNVVEFLLLDRCFPRSIFFCLSKAEISLHAISGSSPGGFCNSAEQKLGALRSELAFSRIEDIIGHGVHEYLDRLQGRINEVGAMIHETYFELRPYSIPASQVEVAQ
jgi:uncharacterized alpha-E superfamily protein